MMKFLATSLCVFLLQSCTYVTVSAPQFEALRSLFPGEAEVDFSPFTWELRWGGEAQSVVAVTLPDQVVFTEPGGVTVTFDGWQVRRVTGLLGPEPVNLAVDGAGRMRIDIAGRQVYEGRCSSWIRSAAGYSQACEGLGVNSIELGPQENITRLSFIIHPAYPALSLRR